jgi:hypothetical protein
MLEQAGQSSDLVEIAKRNGDFRRNYGTLLSAFLYLRSLSAARGRSLLCSRLIAAVLSAALLWLRTHGWLSHGAPILGEPAVCGFFSGEQLEMIPVTSVIARIGGVLEFIVERRCDRRRPIDGMI